MVSGGKTAGTTSGGAPKRPIKLSQEMVVVGISALLFLIFSIGLDNFLSKGNIIALLKNVSILGTLAVGMGFVVVGRGIDL
ncbi:MAG: ABC transporter permease, partial [Rhizobium sp.]